jgi:thymidylate kinase
MNGILIVEGPDGAGKTTLINQLREHWLFKTRYMHLRVHKEMEKWHCATARRAIRLSKDYLVILDRHWPSEQIYSYERSPGPSYDPTNMVDWLKSHGAIYIWAIPEDYERLIEEHKTRREERHEEYHDITSVVKRYYDHWYGTYEGPDNYLKKIQPLNKRDDFIRYDRFTDKDILDKIINRLRP